MEYKVQIKIRTTINKEYLCHVSLKIQSQRKINDVDIIKYLNDHYFVKDSNGTLISCKQIESFTYSILE